MKRLLFLLLSTALILGACGNKKEEYKNNLQESVDKIMNSAIKAEGLVDNYAQLWNFTIKSKGATPIATMAATVGISEDEVMEFFPINSANNINQDFSENINALKSYYDANGDILELEGSLLEIEKLTSDLKNPPDEFKEVYSEVLDLYNLTNEYVRMAVNPSGSLQDYNADNKKLTTDILNKKKRIDVVMPD